ncbi:MAG: orotate phosphoribosyltransferase [Candidatus Diapherotrites archaeon]|nr:orotate phosphoribosyltransferase [Candidatus Diapherotrites archaeon]
MNARKELSVALFETGIVKFGSFTLKSGIESPIYLDLRVLVSHPKLLMLVAKLLAEKARPLKFDRIAGIPYAALAIATAVSIESGWPMIFARKEAKDYGTKKLVEGEFNAGETVLVIDDLITTGGSKLEGAQPFLDAGLLVNDFLVIVDRDQGGREEMVHAGYRLHYVLSIHELLSDLLESGKISRQQFDSTESFLAATKQVPKGSST